MWTYMGGELDSLSLPKMEDLIAVLSENGADNRALSGIREEQWERFGKELIWLYPISEGESAGGFIIPVQEGILWIPYNAMDREDGELLELKEAHLLSAEACGYLKEDLRSYVEGLCDVLQEAAVITNAMDAKQYHEQEEAK